MMTYEGNGGMHRSFLTSVLDRGEWLASRRGGFTLGKRAIE